MTLREALSYGRKMLSPLGTQDVSLECELLLRHVLKIDRVRLYLSLDEVLTAEEKKIFLSLIKRRLANEPVAYITGQREFYGLDFYTNKSVLIPRPETELLVEKALSLAQKINISAIADIGTGSGVIAVILALKLPTARIYATDISASALGVARFNAQKHGVAERIIFLEGDLLKPLPEPCDIIVANLPYVGEELPPFEPPIALDGGENGLRLIRKFCREVVGKLHKEGYFLLEVGLGQPQTVKELILSLYPEAEIEISKDLAGIERVICAKLA